MRTAIRHSADLGTQAQQIQRRYPELYAYLAGREELLRSALRRLPDPADTELSAVMHPTTRLSSLLKDLGPGIAELNGN